MEKQRWEESRRRRKEVRRSEKRKREKKEDGGAWKGRKVAIHCVFPMICGSGGSKSNLAKAAGAEPAGQMRDEKLHAVVARSKFPSQTVQSTPCSEHFWKLRCWKSARRCGAKQISKSNCTKHTMFGALLEVEMLKKRRPLWREAHFQIKMSKTHHAQGTFGSWEVGKVDTAVARSIFPSQNLQNTTCTDHFWRLICCLLGRRKGLWTPQHYTTQHNTTQHYTTLHYTTRNYKTLGYTPLHYTPPHYTPPHYTPLHYITLHSATPRYTTPTTTTMLLYITLH